MTCLGGQLQKEVEGCRQDAFQRKLAYEELQNQWKISQAKLLSQEIAGGDSQQLSEALGNMENYFPRSKNSMTAYRQAARRTQS